MAKLTLVAEPTFPLEVDIPRPGKESVKVVFVAKFIRRKDIPDFIKSREGKTDLQSVLEMVQGWDLVDTFNEENVGEMIDLYGGSPVAIYARYLEELQGKARRGN